ncbi:MAG: patatin-like phospholipase family protein [Anaerolineae bacterium]
MEQNLRRIPFFAALPDDILAAIGQKLHLEHHRKDDIVFHEGGPGDALYLIESGQVEVVIKQNGEEKILSYLGPGAFFGEMALLLGERRSATVRVVIDADLFVLRKSDFDELLAQYPPIALTFSRELSRRLIFTDRHPTIRDEYNIVALVGDKVGELALSLAQQTGQRVLLFDLGGLPPSLDTARWGEHDVTIMDAESTAYLRRGGLAESLGTLVERFKWVFLCIPPRKGEISAKAMELADVTVQIGEPVPQWKQVLAQTKHWIVPDTPAAIDRLARRIARRVVGLALSSGSARGIAHIGVLRVLEEEGIPVDMIAGTSAGALFGSLYAAGLSLDEITAFTKELPGKVSLRGGLWDFNLPPRSGLIKGKRTLNYLRQYLGDMTFDDLQLPFFVVATDILSGEEVVFDSGPVVEAVRASISVIGVFDPAPVSGRYLIDGGAVNPVPTSVLEEKGADIIIASSVIPSLEERIHRQQQLREGRSPGFIGVILSMMEIMESEIIGSRIHTANVLIKPAVEMYSGLDFEKADELIREGGKAARQELDKIKALVQK